MTDTRSPLDRQPRRIDFSSEEQWFINRVLKGRLDRTDETDTGIRPIAATLGKVEAGVFSFTVREAQRLRDAVSDYATDPAVSLQELALSMVVIERIEGAFDLPRTDET